MNDLAPFPARHATVGHMMKPVRLGIETPNGAAAVACVESNSGIVEVAHA